MQEERARAELARLDSDTVIDLTAAEVRLQEAQAEVLQAFEAWRLQLPPAGENAD